MNKPKYKMCYGTGSVADCYKCHFDEDGQCDGTINCSKNTRADRRNVYFTEVQLND